VSTGSSLESIAEHEVWHDKHMPTMAASCGGDNIAVYGSPQVPLPPMKFSQISMGARVVSSIFVWPELGLSPIPPRSKILLDGDLSRSWLPASSGLHRQLCGRCLYKLLGFLFKTSPTYALLHQKPRGGIELHMAHRRGMQKEDGAELFKDLCFISISCKDVLVRVGFR
jgi:hypothetical protein